MARQKLQDKRLEEKEAIEEQIEEAKQAKQTFSKATNTAFILMFPCLILAGMAAYYAHSIYGSVLAIALGIYQFLMLKTFIEDYYKK